MVPEHLSLVASVEQETEALSGPCVRGLCCTFKWPVSCGAHPVACDQSVIRCVRATWKNRPRGNEMCKGPSCSLRMAGWVLLHRSRGNGHLGSPPPPEQPHALPTPGGREMEFFPQVLFRAQNKSFFHCFNILSVGGSNAYLRLMEKMGCL